MIDALQNRRIEAIMAPTAAKALRLDEFLFTETTPELSRAAFVTAAMEYAAATKFKLETDGPSLYSILVLSPKSLDNALKHSGLERETISRSMSELTAGYIHFDILYKDDPRVCQRVLAKVFSAAHRVQIRIKNPETGFIESRELRLNAQRNN